MDLALSYMFFYQLEKVCARFVKIYSQNANSPEKNFSGIAFLWAKHVRNFILGLNGQSAWRRIQALQNGR